MRGSARARPARRILPIKRIVPIIIIEANRAGAGRSLSVGNRARGSSRFEVINCPESAARSILRVSGYARKLEFMPGCLWSPSDKGSAALSLPAAPPLHDKWYRNEKWKIPTVRAGARAPLHKFQWFNASSANESARTRRAVCAAGQRRARGDAFRRGGKEKGLIFQYRSRTGRARAFFPENERARFDVCIYN